MNRIAEIHVLKSRSGMDDEDYRAFLSGWGVSSSKELTPRQAAEVVARLRELAGQPVRRPKKRISGEKVWRIEPYKSLAVRSSEWPSCEQLWMLLDGLWMSVTRQASRDAAIAAFEEWLYKRFGIAKVEWITRSDVGKIKRALEGMGARKLD